MKPEQYKNLLERVNDNRQFFNIFSSTKHSSYINTLGELLNDHDVYHMIFYKSLSNKTRRDLIDYIHYERSSLYTHIVNLDKSYSTSIVKIETTLVLINNKELPEELISSFRIIKKLL